MNASTKRKGDSVQKGRLQMNTSRLYLYNIVARLLPETRCFRFKAFMLAWCGAKVGRNVRICSSAKIFGNGNLSIGDNVWIGERCFIKATSPAGIEIGSCCDIAPQVTLMTGTHEINAEGSRVAGKGCGRSITIGDGCWLCMCSTVLPGVELARRTLVAAGAVVTKGVTMEGTLVAGVPARELRKI